MQPVLPVSRLHDLPPRWDGRVVAWDGWEVPNGPVFICPPLPKSCCEACGSAAQQPMNRGRVAISPRTTRDEVLASDAARNRLPVAWRGKLKPLALYELVAWRCPDCLQDMVMELRGGWWRLDESDYGEEGSVEP